MCVCARARVRPRLSASVRSLWLVFSSCWLVCTDLVEDRLDLGHEVDEVDLHGVEVTDSQTSDLALRNQLLQGLASHRHTHNNNT